ncbi:MAG: STAS domain-containing protein [Erysipelotrichaceae bacterium]|nr:STAS domain-containing protein [Erysipelotrichaceae bacterium]
MEINKVIKDDSCRLELSGRLDTITSPQLEEELKELPENISELTLDLKDLEYVSSAGLRVFLNAQKTMSAKGQMALCNVNEEIMEVLEMTGFTEILTIE